MVLMSALMMDIAQLSAMVLCHGAHDQLLLRQAALFVQ